MFRVLLHMFRFLIVLSFSLFLFFFFFKQKSAYEMRISDWSSDVCSSDLPATNLGLTDRGFLRPGYFADVVIFDPRTIADHSTFEKPHVYATGVRDVLVNGVPVLAGGEHTGAKPGRFVRKPGAGA